MTGDAYTQEYWDSLDGGIGYQDSTLHEDLAFIVHEIFGTSKGRDLAPDVNVLDMGCGAGFLTRHLRRRGHDAWGVDISEYALSIAPEDVKPYLRWHDLTAYGVHHQFGDNSFRLITCFETLEHIEKHDLGEVMNRIRGTLTDDGYAVLAICTAERPDPWRDPTHRTIEPRAWWEQLLRDCGFRQVSDLESRVRGFYLFSEHPGVFVVQRMFSHAAEEAVRPWSDS